MTLSDRVLGPRIGPPERGWFNRAWRWKWLQILNHPTSRSWNAGKKLRNR